MLDKGIVRKTVPNIIHYYTEYCCDSQLINFINECDDEPALVIQLQEFLSKEMEKQSAFISDTVDSKKK